MGLTEEADMRSTETRLATLEKGSTNYCPVFRMSIGETEGEARVRYGLSGSAAVLFIQRVIVKGGGRHAQQ
jgi:hypothetical protein